MLSVFERAEEHRQRIAVRAEGKQFSYDYLLERSRHLAFVLLNGRADLREERVSFMVTPGVDYVATLWSIWRAGGIAVPLCITHPVPSLRYTLSDSGSSVLVISPLFAEVVMPLASDMGLRIIVLERDFPTIDNTLPDIDADRRAMILYTSGTTNLPKGVVTTHNNIQAQISTLVTAWRWSQADHILCVLPLHHVHGIINVVSCALWSGACCEFADFIPSRVFEIFLAGLVNVFMAVPTIYFKLITYWESVLAEDQQRITACLENFRLMVSGSAALPVSVMQKWQKISHHTLLERYGMTELGMAISNPYEGERRPGYIGHPLPSVSVRLCDEKDTTAGNGPGEIQVKGPGVFKEYWQRPEETSKSFTSDGWFRTGDVAVLENGYFRILGRSSVDIIKSGGYKISALEIEEVLRTHPAILDCSVVGLENEEWGEIVAAAIIRRTALEESELTEWLKTQMPTYRIPRKFIWTDELPRNQMGKVPKTEVKKMFKR